MYLGQDGTLMCSSSMKEIIPLEEIEEVVQRLHSGQDVSTVGDSRFATHFRRSHKGLIATIAEVE